LLRKVPSAIFYSANLNSSLIFPFGQHLSQNLSFSRKNGVKKKAPVPEQVVHTARIRHHLPFSASLCQKQITDRLFST
jgi:hypothetical protein